MSINLSSVTDATRLANGVISQVQGLLGGPLGSPTWYSRLRPASFRGVPFAVLASESRFGRRVMPHEYPFRDVPYTEDLGRAARRISIQGFLVENSAIYGGGDVLGQRDDLVAACEEEGAGTLIHPTLGELRMSVVDGGLAISERWDQGRYFEIGFTFIEAGERILPGIVVDTGDAVTAAAADANSASALDFARHAVQELKQGAAVVAKVVGTAQVWTRTAQRLANDATNLKNMASKLKSPRSLGRFASGNSLSNSLTRILGS